MRYYAVVDPEQGTVAACGEHVHGLLNRRPKARTVPGEDGRCAVCEGEALEPVAEPASRPLRIPTTVKSPPRWWKSE